MNRIKRIRPLLFFVGLLFGIALFFVYSVAAIIPINTVSTLSADQTDKSSGKNSGRRIASLNNERIGEPIVSRGGNRDSDYRLNLQEKKSMQTAVSGDSDAVNQISPADSSNAAPSQTTKPAVQSTSAKAAPAKPAAQSAPAKTATAKQPVQPSAQTNAASQYEQDLDLLARLVTAEAQGEPYEAKVAVGAVVINRVQSGQWANTIKGVIYQKSGGYYQFTTVVNGWINKPAEPESIKAAKAAMSGADPTNGAQFYYDDTVTNTWILSKPVSVRIGHMIYAF